MKKNAPVQYFVEGENEKKLVNVLKNDLKVILPGKVQVLNVIQKDISSMILRTLKRGTVVILIFDTDTNNVNILNRNIQKLDSYPTVSNVITIPQVKNLEDELKCSCNIRQIKDLLNSRSDSEFKSDLIHITNLGSKLKEHSFDINRFWSMNPQSPYDHIINMANEIKINNE